jgi:hypothetical protein
VELELELELVVGATACGGVVETLGAIDEGVGIAIDLDESEVAAKRITPATRAQTSTIPATTTSLRLFWSAGGTCFLVTEPNA